MLRVLSGFAGLAAAIYVALWWLVPASPGQRQLAAVTWGDVPAAQPAPVVRLPPTPMPPPPSEMVVPTRAMAGAGVDLDDAAPVLGGGSGSAPTDRHAQAVVLQRALKSPGCYAGDVDGDWGSDSRRAMTRFLVAANAALPVADPSDVLTALVAAKADIRCGPDKFDRDGQEARARTLPAAERLRAARTLPPPLIERHEPRDHRWASEPRARNSVFQQLFGGG